MKSFTVGKAYNVIQNGEERTFTLLEKRDTAQYVLKWEDNDQDSLTIVMERATNVWKMEHDVQTEGDIDSNPFTVGKTYSAQEQGKERNFTVIEKRNTVSFIIKWEDNDQEIITELPLLDIWTEAWKKKYGLENFELEGDVRRNVKVQGHVKESLEKLKSEFQFKTESDVIQALIELYQETEYYPKIFVDRLLQSRR